MRMNQTPRTMVYSESMTTASLMVATTELYASGTIFGSVNGTTNGPGAIPIRAAYENGGAGEVVTVTFAGPTTSYPFNLWLFNAPIAGVATNGATFTLAGADKDKFLGVVGISGTDYYIPGAGIPMAFVGTGVNVFTASTTTAIVGYLVACTVAGSTAGVTTSTLAVNVIHAS